MFRQKEWIFSGKSGEEYTFEIFAKTRPIPEYGGIYILSYTHPRGHRAGFLVNMLYAGETDNFSNEMENPPQADCLWDGCWNCIYLLRIEDPSKRTKVLSDLINGNEIKCQD